MHSLSAWFSEIDQLVCYFFANSSGILFSLLYENGNRIPLNLGHLAVYMLSQRIRREGTFSSFIYYLSIEVKFKVYLFIFYIDNIWLFSNPQESCVKLLKERKILLKIGGTLMRIHAVTTYTPWMYFLLFPGLFFWDNQAGLFVLRSILRLYMISSLKELNGKSLQFDTHGRIHVVATHAPWKYFSSFLFIIWELSSICLFFFFLSH